MDNIFISIIAFVAALGVLVTVHEFGHFWVARKLGVKVIRFAVGFGVPIWRYQRHPDDVEYVIAAIPLGGYVKMLDEREEEVPEALQDKAFNRQPLHYRTAIVAAGPMFNFMLAIIAYWIMYMAGVPGMKAVIGEVEPESVAAYAGIEAGDEILAVDGVATPTWNAASMEVIGNTIGKQQLSLTVKSEFEAGRTVDLALPALSQDFGKQDGLATLGIHPWIPDIPPVIGDVLDDSPADQAGLKQGDRLIAANGKSISDWIAWVKFVRERPQQQISIEIEREGTTLTLQLRPEQIESNGKVIGRIGAAPAYKGEMPEEMKAIESYGLFSALQRAVVKTWDMSVLSLQVMSRMIIGQVSVENLSGPITIAKYAGFSAQAGLVSFLAFLAVVSLSLGVINLLPIPLLDGGHLLYYAIEFVKGSPLSEEAQFFGQRIGIAIIVMLMSLALYNDLIRLLG